MMRKDTFNNLNVVVTTHDSVLPVRGGGALRTLKIAEEFAKRGCSTILLAPCIDTDRLKGIEIRRIKPPDKKYCQVLSVLSFTLSFIFKFLKLDRKPEILLSHNTISAIGIVFLKKLFKFRFFLDLTDIHTEYIKESPGNFLERLLIPCMSWYEYLIIKSADSITAVSLEMKRFLSAKGVNPENIRVVSDGIDADLPYINIKKNRSSLNVIHLGTIDTQHGVETVVESIPFVAEASPAVNFIFIGSGRGLLPLIEKAKTLRVIDRCIFTGSINSADTLDYLAQSTLGIISRPLNRANDLVTTLKIFEYWASQTVCLSSPLGALKEIAQENYNIIWFDPRSPRDLADKIIYLFEKEDLRKRLVKGGLSTVKEFDMSESAVKIVDFALE